MMMMMIAQIPQIALTNFKFHGTQEVVGLDVTAVSTLALADLYVATAARGRREVVEVAAARKCEK